MHVDLMTFPRPLQDMGDVARDARDVGFDGLLFTEGGRTAYLSAAVAATSAPELHLSTGVAVAFPRSPMVVANTAWDLQTNSHGRFALGLGPQVKGHNERRFSVPWSPPVPRLREYIEALRAIWRCCGRRARR